MKEQLISFETAKLAKEKGFNEYCYNSYKNSTKQIYSHLVEGIEDIKKYKYLKRKSLFRKNLEMLNAKDERYSAPTQTLLQKWLREKFDIDVYVIPNGMRDKSISKRLYHPIIWFKDEYQSELHSKYSYEEALEKGLQEALKLIK